MKKTLAVVLAAILFFAVGIGGAHWANERRERAELARDEARARSAALRAAIAQREKAVAQAASARSVAQENSRAASPKPAPVATEPKTINRETKESRNRVLVANPELLALYKKQLRAGAEQKYAPLCRQLQLTPEQARAFVDLLMRRDDMEEDLWRVARERNLSFQDPILKTLRDQQVEEQQAALRQLLGPAGVAAMQQFDRALPVREVVTDAASLVAYTPNPMTRDQIDQLTRICAECSESFRRGGRANAQTIDWDSVLVRAATFLPEPQLAAIRAEAQRLRVSSLIAEFYKQRGVKY